MQLLTAQIGGCSWEPAQKIQKKGKKQQKSCVEVVWKINCLIPIKISPCSAAIDGRGGLEDGSQRLLLRHEASRWLFWQWQNCVRASDGEVRDNNTEMRSLASSSSHWSQFGHIRNYLLEDRAIPGMCGNCHRRYHIHIGTDLNGALIFGLPSRWRRGSIPRGDVQFGQPPNAGGPFPWRSLTRAVRLTIGRIPQQAGLHISMHSLHRGLINLWSPSCLSQAHRCLFSLQSLSGTASSWGQSLRGSFLGQIQIAQIIPVGIVWIQISPLQWWLGPPLGRIPRYCFAIVAAKWRTSST
jgi:hypothetical protein